MSRSITSLLWVGLAGCSALLPACSRGLESEDPPIHLNPNMDSQPRYDPQAESKFFEDRRTERTPVEGTVSRGNLDEDDAYVRGHEGDHYVVKIPVPITEELTKRGQERFNIYCTPCHDKTGTGQGLVVKHGYPPPTNLQQDYALHMSDGQIFSAISYGVRNMPSYGAQIPVPDRWAIVAYVRALQFSQHASLSDVPQESRSSLTVESNP